IRPDVERLAAVDAGERDEVAALLRLLALLVEPETDFRSAGDFLADGMNVLIPRERFAGDEQLAGAGTIEIVALADRPLHPVRPAVDDVVWIHAAAATAAAAAAGRDASVDGIGIVLQHEVRD